MNSLLIETDVMVALPPDVLEPLEDQPRTEIEESAIREIGENAVDLRSRGLGKLGTGFIDTLTVRLPSGALDDEGRLKPGVKLPIVGGSTRWNACLYVQAKYGAHALPTLPCVVENIAPEDAFEIAFLANLLRRNYTDLQEAVGYLRLKNAKKYTFEQLAAKVQKSVGYLQNKVDVAGAKDTHILFDGRKNALYLARRLSQIKDPQTRAAMIEAVRVEKPGSDELDEWLRSLKTGLPVERLRAYLAIAAAEKKHEREARAANRQGTGGQSTTYSLPSFDPVLASDAMVRQAKTLRDGLGDKNLPAGTKRKLRKSLLSLKNEVDALFVTHGSGRPNTPEMEIEASDD